MIFYKIAMKINVEFIGLRIKTNVKAMIGVVTKESTKRWIYNSIPENLHNLKLRGNQVSEFY